ncbi:hypothetical protein [Actinomadura sp. NPDC048394]|uniref:hypothetical protein n=1 Tax=Actinomadura sp. NPDC048394 TaxID=3158223 RepID=UPI0033C0734B
MTTPAGAASVATKPGPGTTGGKAAQPAPAAPWPFPVGVYESDVQDYDQQVTQTTSAQQMPLWNLSPTGWLRGVWFDFTMTVTGQSTNNVSYAGDNPFSVVQKCTLYDLGGEVVQQYTGYDWMAMNKFGGYHNVGDPRADITYSATTGTGSTGGSFHFTLFLPLEVVARDSLGTVQNESKPGWKVEIYIDSQANTYNQVPSVQGVLRLRGYPSSYTEPAAAAPSGRAFAQTPPLPGTLQYIKSESNTIAAGNSRYDLTNGIGFPIRSIIYKLVDTTTPTRAAGDADWPDPYQLLLGNVQLRNIGKNRYLTKLGRDFGLTSATADTALGRENGVFPQYFFLDFTLKPGSEVRMKYLDTQVNTLLRLTGSFGASCTLSAQVNWLATPSKNRYALIAGSGA